MNTHTIFDKGHTQIESFIGDTQIKQSGIVLLLFCQKYN